MVGFVLDIKWRITAAPHFIEAVMMFAQTATTLRQLFDMSGHA